VPPSHFNNETTLRIFVRFLPEVDVMCLDSYPECSFSNLGTETAAFSPGITQSLRANCEVLPRIRLTRLLLKYFQIYFSTVVKIFESLWGVHKE
jgi:hypothetical protein